MTTLEQPHHQAREQKVAELLAAKWKCDWGQMGPYSPFDVYLRRDKTIYAIVEIRTLLSRQCHTFPLIFLDLDKWFSLMQAEIGLKDVLAFYVIAFSEGIYALRIGTTPVNHFKINYRGRTGRPQAKNDMCPVIEVPSSEFKLVCPSTGVFTEENLKYVAEQAALGYPTHNSPSQVKP